MDATLSRMFIRASVVYAVLGMAFGLHMAASGDHGQIPTHAHLMLLGWVGMTIYAVVYKLWPATAEGMLPKTHAVVAHLALIGMVVGLYIIYGGNMDTGEPIASIASIASIATLANTALFGIIVWRRI